MVSLSHWGMHGIYRSPIMVAEGFKLSEADMAEWNKPFGIIRLVPLAQGEPQPIYIRPAEDEFS